MSASPTDAKIGQGVEVPLDNPLGQDRPRNAQQVLWRALGRRQGVFRDALIATIVVNTLALVVALYTMQVYDRVIPHTGYNTLIVLFVGVLVALALELLLKQLRSHLVDRESTQIDAELTDWFFDRAQHVRMECRPAALGTLAAQIKGLEYLRGMLSGQTIFLLADIPFAVLFISVIAWIGGSIALVPVVLVPVTLAVGLIFQRRVRRAVELSQGHSNHKAGLLVEALDGIESVKATGSERNMQAAWQELILNAGDDEDRVKDASAMSTNLAASLQQVGYVTMVAFGAALVVNAQLTMGGLIACAIISQRALGPIARLPGALVQWVQAKTSLQMLDSMIELPNELDESDRTVNPEVIENSLRFERVEFTYGQNANLALDVPLLEVASGQRVGIVGPIGSGKSTLLKVASGLFRPEMGQVFLGGLDISKISHGRVRELIAYLPQDVRLTSGTLRDNVIRGLSDPGDEAILAAARRTGLIHLINTHPLGLALPLTEGGRGLSGGQRQLVAFTRLLLVDPAVFLLDEPTASMDTDTEGNIAHIISQLASDGKTVLISTHKTALLPFVDRLVVCKQGRIVLDGPREEVVAHLRPNQSGQRGGRDVSAVNNSLERSDDAAEGDDQPDDR
jgi:ATP-binding cassette subfamily C protein LapB